MQEAPIKPELKGLLGLCVRARQAVFGEDACMKAVRSGKCPLLLLDAGASQATREKYEGTCGHYGVPMQVLPPGFLGEATGKPGVAMALQPGSLAARIVSLMSQATDSEGTKLKTEPQRAGKDSGGASVE